MTLSIRSLLYVNYTLKLYKTIRQISMKKNKVLMDTAQRKIDKWPKSTGKLIISLSGKYKIKPQGDTTTHLPEWLQ